MRFNAHDNDFLGLGGEGGHQVGNVHAEGGFVDVSEGVVLGVEGELGAGGAEGFAVLGGGVDGEVEDLARFEHFLGGGDACHRG